MHVKENRNALVAYNTILSNLHLFECEYVRVGYNVGDIIFLATDHKNKQFVSFEGRLRGDGEVAIARIDSAKEMYEKIKKLKLKRYKNLYKNNFLKKRYFVDYQAD